MNAMTQEIAESVSAVIRKWHPEPASDGAYFCAMRDALAFANDAAAVERIYDGLNPFGRFSSDSADMMICAKMKAFRLKQVDPSAAEMEDKRWRVVVSYITGMPEAEFFIEELQELQVLIERGPDFYIIETIKIRHRPEFGWKAA